MSKVDLQITSVAKRTSVVAALSGPSTGSVWSFGFDRDGTGISNHMIIQNHTDDSFRLHEYYVNWGRARVPPDAKLRAHYEDDCLFHAAGGWCATGSSGIVTYKLDPQTYLHILWDCPYNFNHYCNFVGLFLCDEKKNRPDADLFNKMYQYDDDSSFVPGRCTAFDLVCCGPGERAPNSNGTVRWGVRRPCEVVDNNYRVTMTMGDGHKTSSSVSIFKTKPSQIYVRA
ncbi:uncharacterized protein [Macrobrachium rosenbergii]|uniref:uncharacterized protein n=1 Tax=Macrobrachium rosenbergii TaxID=79674 RepID=UPI0034D41C98